MPTMPVYLVEVLGISTANVGIALSSYTIGLLCVRPFSGFLVDCFSRKPLYLFAFFVFAFMFGGYLIATTMLTIMAVRFVQGGFMGLTSVAGNTIAIDVIPSSRRGEGMGFLRSDNSIWRCRWLRWQLLPSMGKVGLIRLSLSVGWLLLSESVLSA